MNTSFSGPNAWLRVGALSVLFGPFVFGMTAVAADDAQTHAALVTMVSPEATPSVVVGGQAKPLADKQRLPDSATLVTKDGFIRVYFGAARSVIHVFEQTEVGYLLEGNTLKLNLGKGTIRVYTSNRASVRAESGQAVIVLSGAETTIRRDLQPDRTLVRLERGRAQVAAADGQPTKLRPGDLATLAEGRVTVESSGSRSVKTRRPRFSVGLGGLTPVSFERTAIGDVERGGSAPSAAGGREIGRHGERGAGPQADEDVSTAATAASAAAGNAQAVPVAQAALPDVGESAVSLVQTVPASEKVTAGSSRAGLTSGKQGGSTGADSRLFLLGGQRYSGGKPTPFSVLPTQRSPAKNLLLQMLRGVTGTKTGPARSRVLAAHRSSYAVGKGTLIRRLPRYQLGPKRN